MDSLKAKHNESISASIKIAILVGMLPKEYQDMCFQQATEAADPTDLEYNEMRDKIMNIANQRVSMVTPTPMDIDAVRDQHVEGGGEDWGSFGIMGRTRRAGKNLNLTMVLSQWEREGEREMAAAITVDNSDVGPGNVRASQREGERKRLHF